MQQTHRFSTLLHAHGSVLVVPDDTRADVRRIRVATGGVATAHRTQHTSVEVVEGLLRAATEMQLTLSLRTRGSSAWLEGQRELRLTRTIVARLPAPSVDDRQCRRRVDPAVSQGNRRWCFSRSAGFDC